MPFEKSFVFLACVIKNLRKLNILNTFEFKNYGKFANYNLKKIYPRSLDLGSTIPVLDFEGSVFEKSVLGLGLVFFQIFGLGLERCVLDFTSVAKWLENRAKHVPNGVKMANSFLISQKLRSGGSCATRHLSMIPFSYPTIFPACRSILKLFKLKNLTFGSSPLPPFLSKILVVRWIRSSLNRTVQRLCHKTE